MFVALLIEIFILIHPTWAFANIGFVKQLQPVFSPNLDQTSWDSMWVATSFLLKQNGFDSMWYAGHGSSGDWQLGFAKYDDTVGQWSRSLTQLKFQGDSDIPENNASDPFLIIDDINHSYKMWYDAINAGQYTVRYATSSDGLIWTKYKNAVLQGGPNPWDVGGIARGKSIVYRDGIYHMWYSGGTVGSWQIGYAISNDGITWVKQNNGQPVITKTKTWEYNNVSYPYVLLKDNVYHMWYATGSWDLPTSIVYAKSTDGINWDKPANLNPVLSIGTTGDWDGGYIASPFVLVDDDKLSMWYSGFNRNKWQIGIATASASILGPTPPTKQVLVIPGITASWNYDALVNCKKDGYSGDWTLADYAQSIYNPITQTLDAAGWITKLYPYDWRKRISDNETLLREFINSNLPDPREKIDIVGHSMGGLLARTYIEQEKGDVRAEKLITVGSPHLGSVKAYRTWSNGETPDGNPIWKFLLTLLKKRCSLNTKFNDRAAIQEYFPSVNNLLPTFKYLIDNVTGLINPVTYAINDWLPNTNFTAPFYGVKVGTLRGTGQPTDVSYRVEPPKNHDEKLGNWADGIPVVTNQTTEGDGTVLEMSAQILDADNSRVISADHTGLISSSLGIQKILDFLGTPPLTTQAVTLNIPVPTSESSGLFIISSSNFWIKDVDGKVKKDSNGLMSFINPKSGSYKTLFIPKQHDSLVILVQVLPDGNTLYREYTIENFLPKIRTIKYDPENPVEDAMK